MYPFQRPRAVASGGDGARPAVRAAGRLLGSPPETALEALELVEVLFIFSLEKDPQKGDLLDRAMRALRAGLRALHARTVLQSS